MELIFIKHVIVDGSVKDFMYVDDDNDDNDINTGYPNFKFM